MKNEPLRLANSVYELCTGVGFSGCNAAFRPFKTPSVVRIHAGPTGTGCVSSRRWPSPHSHLRRVSVKPVRERQGSKFERFSGVVILSMYFGRVANDGEVIAPTEAQKFR
jgi:hypothetical protein